MSFTQTQLAALEAAYASGTLTVRYDGKEVTYRSLAELERVMLTVRRQLNPSATTDRFSFAAFRRS